MKFIRKILSDERKKSNPESGTTENVHTNEEVDSIKTKRKERRRKGRIVFILTQKVRIRGLPNIRQNRHFGDTVSE